MSFDLQMARDSGDGSYNLAIGEPFFLQATFLRDMRIQHAPRLLTYPRVGGEPELVQELRRSFPQYKHIVVTNGAKQGLEASFFALKRLERRSVVVHRPPYWPSYPTLAQNQGLGFNAASLREAQIRCVTAPNNPDGSQSFLLKGDRYDLWDAAYAQPLYGYFGVAPEHRIAVFSAAKNLGLSGLRVGWVGTNEDELAAQVAYHVEITTSGVSIPSQMHLLGVLQALRDPKQIARFTDLSFEARAALMTNGNSFNELISSITEKVQGVPRDGSGMFAWFRARKPEAFARALQAARVKAVTGEACGEPEPGWYRMSMGHYPETTREALQKLQDEYRR
jgi:aspartate/methionine/tyrosine aminotransferase